MIVKYNQFLILEHITKGENYLFNSEIPNAVIEYVNMNTGQVKTVNTEDIIINKDKVYDNDYVIFDLKTRSTKIIDRKSAMILWKLLKSYDIDININDLYREEPEQQNSLQNNSFMI